DALGSGGASRAWAVALDGSPISVYRSRRPTSCARGRRRMPWLGVARAVVEGGHGLAQEGRGVLLRPHAAGIEPARDIRQHVGEDGVQLLGVLALKRGGGSLAGARTRDPRTRFVCRPVEPSRNGLEELQDRIGVLLPQVGRETAGLAYELLGHGGGNGGVLEERVIDTRLDVGRDDDGAHPDAELVEGEGGHRGAERLRGGAVTVRQPRRWDVIE